MQKPSHGRPPLSCRARGPAARLRQCRWARADVSVCGVPRPSAVSRMLGLNAVNVNIFSWIPPDPGSAKPYYVTSVGLDCTGVTAIRPHHPADVRRQPAPGVRRGYLRSTRTVRGRRAAGATALPSWGFLPNASHAVRRMRGDGRKTPRPEAICDKAQPHCALWHAE